MRAEDTAYRRIWWLRRGLGADAYTLVGDLLAASWESSDDPQRKARYQLDFAQAAEALPRARSQMGDWFWIMLRAANAYRELGRFEDGARLLDAVRQANFLPSEPDEALAARGFIEGLAALIAERNRHPEPTNMVGPTSAAARCRASPSDLSAVERTACASEAHRAAIAEQEEWDRDSQPADEETNAEAADDAAGPLWDSLCASA